MNPGIHSIPAEQYHASDAVSNSRLKWIAAPLTPAHYKARWIDKLIPEETTPAKEFGSLLHRCMLEPETTKDAFYIKPEGMKFTTKEGIAWRDAHADRRIVTAEEAGMVNGIVASIQSHPKASAYLAGSYRERSVFAELDGLSLKSRFDLLPRWEGANFIADLKTCEDASPDGAAKAAWDFGYYRQAAFYLKVAALAGLPVTTFLFIFVEKGPPYLVNVLEIDPALLAYGQGIVNRDLTLLRHCLRTGEWPGYDTDIGTLGAPAWKRREIEDFSKHAA